MGGIVAYLVGIDGGGTGSRAVLSTLEGRIVATGSGGPANFQVIGVDETMRSIASTISSMLRHVAGPPVAGREITAVAVGLAGLHTPADKERFAGLLGSLLPHSRVSIWTDADVALAAAIGDGAGIVVIAGTGSIALGRDSSGAMARCGGWGYLIGDEGSAYAIAREGLRAASRGLDGRSGANALGEAFAQALSVPGFDHVLRPLYGPPAMSRQQIARLAPVVTQCAAAGDSAARAILAGAGVELAHLVLALAARLALGEATFPIACSGGVWRAGDLVLDSFQRRVHAALPHALVAPAALTAAEGAVFLAHRDAGGGSHGPAFLATLRATRLPE